MAHLLPPLGPIRCPLHCSPAGNGTALVATCEQQVVGVATITPTVDLDLLHANFQLDAAQLPLGSLPVDAHAELGIVMMNPIFEPRAGEEL